MSSDPIKNILRILYDDLTSRVYSIIKSVKKINRIELEKKLKEQLNNINLDSQSLNLALGKLDKESFIKIHKEDIKQKNNTGDAPRLYKRGPTKIEVYTYNNISINLLSNKYNEMKNNLRKNLKEREERKYTCLKCQVVRNENFASRDNYKCQICGKDYIKGSEDVSDISKKCEEIFEILDELFKEEENNANTGINTYYKKYLTSKYGKNFNNDNKVRDTFEEDEDSYINKTINHLNDNKKLFLYELIESLNRSKKK